MITKVLAVYDKPDCGYRIVAMRLNGARGPVRTWMFERRNNDNTWKPFDTTTNPHMLRSWMKEIRKLSE